MKSDHNNGIEKTVFPSRRFFAVLIAVLVLPFIFTKTGCSKHDAEAKTEIVPEKATLPEFTPKGFVNLSNYYNAGLKTNWLGGEIQDRSLADLPTNVQVFNGATFRVEGLIQLQGAILKKRAPWFPDSVKEIPVQMTCSNLHFLHGTAWPMADGSQIGTYVIHYADGNHVEFPIIYGQDVRNWSFNEKDRDQTTKTAWSSKQYAIFFRLYASTWPNPRPEVQVTSIDFVSSGTDCAPFLLAITVE